MNKGSLTKSSSYLGVLCILKFETPWSRESQTNRSVYKSIFSPNDFSLILNLTKPNLCFSACCRCVNSNYSPGQHMGVSKYDFFFLNI